MHLLSALSIRLDHCASGDDRMGRNSNNGQSLQSIDSQRELVVLRVEPCLVRIPQLNVQGLLTPLTAHRFHNGEVIDASMFADEHQVCFVLPEGTRAFMIAMCRDPPSFGDSPFRNEQDFRNYWHYRYGFTLPATVEAYVIVRCVGGGLPLTYPSCCLWTQPQAPILRTQSREAHEEMLSMWLRDLGALEIGNTPLLVVPPETAAHYATPALSTPSLTTMGWATATLRCCPTSVSQPDRTDRPADMSMSKQAAGRHGAPTQRPRKQSSTANGSTSKVVQLQPGENLKVDDVIKPRTIQRGTSRAHSAENVRTPSVAPRSHEMVPSQKIVASNSLSEAQEAWVREFDRALAEEPPQKRAPTRKKRKAPTLVRGKSKKNSV
eukprot:TRINITY_DN1077_c0_g1_i1.p1 TRINITY_DN1077_c0_g1~~TRINITY_DN1077_c0_g1_i1.p1  ORF type:complete len:379 (-),score=26.51 TRINITY_DN1077_c0_g1_i1:107-1243(-)